MANAPNELSFLPDDYVERKRRRRANALCGALSVVVMGTIATAFTLTERALREVEAEHAQVESEYAGAAKQIELFNRMRSQQEQIYKRTELASSLVEKVPRSNLLAEFTNALPDGVSLVDLKLRSKVVAAKADAGAAGGSAFDKRKAEAEAKKKEAAKKNKNAKGGGGEPEEQAAKVYEVKIELTGVATDDTLVAQFIKKLNRSELVTDVNLVISEPFDLEGRAMRKFQIEMMLNPQAEVRERPALNPPGGGSEVAGAGAEAAG